MKRILPFVLVGALLLLTFSCSDSSESKDEFRVIYDGNGQDSGNPPIDDQTYKNGELFVLPDCGNMTKNGHCLTRWSSEPDREDVPWGEPGDMYTMPYGGVTLYAYWEGDPGAVDTSFDIGTGPNQDIDALAIQADGKLLVAGDFTSFNGTTRNGIARLNTDGSLDSSFNPGSGPNDVIRAIAVQSDGKIVVGGSFTTFAGSATGSGVVRLNSDGGIDNTFDATHSFFIVHAVEIQPSDDKILIGGSDGLRRLETNGNNDATFAATITGTVYDIAFQSDGKVLVGGAITQCNGGAIENFVRLDTAGVTDNTVVQPNDAVWTIHVSSDDTVFIGGEFDTISGHAANHVIGIDIQDSWYYVDFSAGYGTNGTVYSIAEQSGGELVIGGWFSKYDAEDAPNGLVRITEWGGIDENFYADYAGPAPRMMVLRGDERVIVAFGTDIFCLWL